MAKPQTNPSEAELKAGPLPYLVRSYKASKAGHKKFSQDIVIAHHAGYEFKSHCALGTDSFSAVFKLTSPDGVAYGEHGSDFAGMDDWPDQ